MAFNLFVIDDAKCLHDLLEVLSEQSVVAPTNHADTTDKYGKGTTTEYGHLMLTNEGNGLDAWDDDHYISLIGKAVSGRDGYFIAQRVATNESNISNIQNDIQTLQEAYKLPVGTIVINDAQSPSQMAQRMGYGTWIKIKSEQIESGGVTYYAEYYYRSQ